MCPTYESACLALSTLVEIRLHHGHLPRPVAKEGETSAVRLAFVQGMQHLGLDLVVTDKFQNAIKNVTQSPTIHASLESDLDRSVAVDEDMEEPEKDDSCPSALSERTDSGFDSRASTATSVSVILI